MLLHPQTKFHLSKNLQKKPSSVPGHASQRNRSQVGNQRNSGCVIVPFGTASSTVSSATQEIFILNRTRAPLFRAALALSTLTYTGSRQTVKKKKNNPSISTISRTTVQRATRRPMESAFSEYGALLRRTCGGRGRKPATLRSNGDRRRPLSIWGWRHGRRDRRCRERGWRRWRRRRLCCRPLGHPLRHLPPLGSGAVIACLLRGNPGGKRSSEGHLGSRR